MKLKVTSVENGKALRGGVVDGEGTLPEVGECLTVVAKPIDPEANIRLFRTSCVQAVDEADDGTLLVRTENSTYRVEVLQ